MTKSWNELPLIEAERLAFGIPGIGKLLGREIRFRLMPGGGLQITGPNGAGKSTLLNVILEQIAPMGGVIRRTVHLEEVAFLPQLANTAFHLPMTLEDILMTTLGKRYSREAVLGLDLLDERHLNLRWNSASGGERKRTLLTRTLLQDPRVLVLDEPMNHLDLDSRKKVAGAIARFLGGPEGLTRGVVLVSHENLAREFLGETDWERLELDGSIAR